MLLQNHNLSFCIIWWFAAHSHNWEPLWCMNSRTGPGFVCRWDWWPGSAGVENGLVNKFTSWVWWTTFQEGMGCPVKALLTTVPGQFAGDYLEIEDSQVVNEYKPVIAFATPISPFRRRNALFFFPEKQDGPLGILHFSSVFVGFTYSMRCL